MSLELLWNLKIKEILSVWTSYWRQYNTTFDENLQQFSRIHIRQRPSVVSMSSILCNSSRLM